MDSTIWAALVGAGATVLIQSTGWFANSLKSRAAARSAARDQARIVVQEAIRAAFDLKVALVTVETRLRDRPAMVAIIAQALVQMLAEHSAGRPLHGAATSLSTARAWRESADAANRAVLADPMARMTTAAAQISMLEDARLREAGAALMTALGDLMSSTGKPKGAARAQAEKQLNEALAGLGDAARAYNGRPNLWHRLTRASTGPQPRLSSGTRTD